MKRLLIISLIILIFLSSCELFYSQNPYTINVITIGMNYSHTSTTLDDLYGTLNDSKDIEQAFKLLSKKNDIEYTSKKYIQDEDSTYIYPSKDNIVSALRDINNNSNENTINIIYYSGHGINSSGSWVLAGKNNDEESAPYDINLALSISEIYELLSDVKGKVVIFSDSCFSGQFYKNSVYTINEKDLTYENAFIKLFSTESENENIYFISATEANNSSWEPNGDDTRLHGYFTKALLDGLGWNDETLIISENIPPAIDNNILSLDSLLKYIKENQNIVLYNENNPSQYPQISGWRYDLTLFKY